MNENERRDAIAAYKERKVAAGIYAVRCAGVNQIWVGSAPDISTIRNRLWFTLRQKSNRHSSLQDAWNSFGEAAFSFEVVEAIDEEKDPYLRDRTLKRRRDHWTIWSIAI